MKLKEIKEKIKKLKRYKNNKYFILIGVFKLFNEIHLKTSKILILFFIFLITTLASSMIETVSATNTTISSTTPGGLKLAIESSQTGDTIYLTKGSYSGENNTNITINKNINIEGLDSKVVLDGQGTNLFFKINQKTVTLKNLKFIHGYNGGKSGGAISSKGNLTVINCTFINNKSYNKINDKGGAIYSTGNVTVTNSIFTNHKAKFGGAIWSSGSLSVTSSIFTNNKASSFGGAIESSVINVKKSIFTNNNASSGGAIKSWSNTNINSCIFKNNRVKNSGGAISSRDNLTVSKCIFTNNKASYEGGAISSDSSKIINSKFNNNKAYLRGGAILFSGIFGKSTVQGCTFTSNQAYLKGKLAVSFYNRKPTGYVTAKGGAIFYFEPPKIINSKFKKNIAGKVYNAIDRDKNLTSQKASLKNVKISPKDGTKVKKK